MAHGTSTTNRLVDQRRARPTAPLAGRARARAFTLVEAMMAAVILAIAVVAIGSSLTSSVRQSGYVEQDSTSLLLARELMEEIAAKPFLDPTTGTVTTNTAAVAARSTFPARSTYNDVGDYHGYTDTIDATHPATTLQGKSAAVTNGRAYTRSVTVEFRATPGGSAATTGDFALVTVTVTPPTGRTVSISRMASNMVLMQNN